MAFGDVVQSNTGTSALATTTPTLGSPTTAGNVVVLTFAADDYNGTPNSGWTQSSEMEQQTFHGGYLWWFKCAGGDTIPGYTIGSAVRSTWTLVEYEGPFDTSPYDVSEGQFVQSSANSYTTANATPTSGDRLLVSGLNAQHSSADLAAWTSFTNSFTQAASSLFNGANPRLSIAQTKLVVTADGSTAYSTGGSHGAQVSQSRSALIIAFKKGAGGTAYTLTAAQGTFSLSGQAATLRAARKLTAVTGSFALSGKIATLRYGYKIGASVGSFSLSGVAANFKRTYALAAATGSFVLSGKNAGLAFNHKLTASAGSFTLSGQSVGLRFGYSLPAASGSFSLSGQAATLRFDRRLVAAAGSFALTGIDANLSYAPVGTSFTLTASTGSFALTGQAATLRSARKLTCGAGSFGLTGQTAGIRFGRTITASQGSFALTGIDADLIYTPVAGYTLTAESGSFLLSAVDAVLTYHASQVGITNPLERLKMYTGSMGSVSNREDWIVNISLVGDDGTSFDLTGSEVVAYVCRRGCPDSPVLSVSIGDGITLTDDYTIQWHFSEVDMAALCPQQYDVFCRVERDDITTQLLAANIAIVEGGPA